MAYENINVTSLKNAISNCKDSAKFTSELSIKDNINKLNVWNSSAKNQLITAFNQLNTKISKLNSVYSNFNSLASNVEKYQNYQKLYDETYQKLQNISYDKKNQREINLLNNRLIRYQNYMNTYSSKVENIKNNILSVLNK